MHSSGNNIGTVAARRTWFTFALAAVTWLLLFLLQMQFGSSPTSSSLDKSWADVLAWGFLHHAQWGRDLVFTYGPIGFLTSDAPFNPHLYWLWLSLQTCMAAIFAWLVAVNLARMHWITAIGFLVTAVILGLAWMSSAPWILSYTLALMALQRTAEDVTARARATWGDVIKVAVLACFEAILILIKFSTFPLWLLWIAAAAIVLRGARNRRLLTVFAACTVLAPLAVWLICAQHLSNFPAFLRLSTEVAAYYGGAMQSPPDRPRIDVYAWVAILFVSACIACALWRRRRSLAEWAVAAIFAATLLLAYRAGATRADNGHLLIFWSSAVWLGVLAIGRLMNHPADSSRWRPAGLMLLMIVPLALLAGSRTYRGWNLHILFRGRVTHDQVEHALAAMRHPLDTYAQRLADWNKLRATLALPHVAKAIGRDRVDLLLDQQDILLANDFNYAPRPVFQSYSTYSDELARLNENYFLSPQAPPWVLFKLPAIDGRYPTADDNKALVRILQLYRPVMQENGILLMQRIAGKTPPPLAPPSAARTVPLSFERMASIPDAGHAAWFANFDIGLTAAGKLQTLLLREPILRLRVTTVNRHQYSFRIPRATTASGFLLSPMLHSNEDYLAWLADSSRFRVVGLQLEQAYFMGQPVFRIDDPMRLYPTNLDRSQNPKDIADFIRFPGFSNEPDQVLGDPTITSVNNSSAALFLHFPNHMTFTLAPGDYRVSASYGIVAGAVSDKGCLAAHADGIGIALGIAGQPPLPGNVAYLDPFRDPHVGTSAKLVRTLTVLPGQQAEVALTEGPPGSNGACDWAWIKDVRFEPVTAGSAPHAH